MSVLLQQVNLHINAIFFLPIQLLTHHITPIRSSIRHSSTTPNSIIFTSPQNNFIQHQRSFQLIQSSTPSQTPKRLPIQSPSQPQTSIVSEATPKPLLSLLRMRSTKIRIITKSIVKCLKCLFYPQLPR